MTGSEVIAMADLKIQQIFNASWISYSQTHTISNEQFKAATSIMACKSGSLGCNVSVCDECGHQEIHNNSCRNRCCPNCQGVMKELWIDARQSEVIDGSYFHVVFTVPSELNPLIISNQKLLYALLHDASSATLLELSASKKYLGATPAIIQVLHTWGQELNYHPHIHCIISGAGLTSEMKLVSSRPDFLIPVRVLGAMFKGKFMASLEHLYRSGSLVLPDSCRSLAANSDWISFRDSLYRKDWCPYIKETFNGFGNAIDYLGRYTHRIAISNSRIEKVTESEVSFWARDYRSSERKIVTLSHEEFIRRFLQHVLPKGFQKIRYYGLLSNSRKKKLLTIVFNIQNHRRFNAVYMELSTEQRLLKMFKIDIALCPCCGCRSMRQLYRTFSGRNAMTG